MLTQDCDPSNYARVHRKLKCPVPGCKEKLTSINTYSCKSCSTAVCMKHRFPSDHDCSSRKGIDAHPAHESSPVMLYGTGMEDATISSCFQWLSLAVWCCSGSSTEPAARCERCAYFPEDGLWQGSVRGTSSKEGGPCPGVCQGQCLCGSKGRSGGCGEAQQPQQPCAAGQFSGKDDTHHIWAAPELPSVAKMDLLRLNYTRSYAMQSSGFGIVLHLRHRHSCNVFTNTEFYLCLLPPVFMGGPRINKERLFRLRVVMEALQPSTSMLLKGVRSAGLPSGHCRSCSFMWKHSTQMAGHHLRWQQV